MKEPNIEQQTAEVIEQYKDLLITKEEYEKALDRIAHRHEEYLNRTK
jgi:hypothetical protein